MHTKPPIEAAGRRRTMLGALRSVLRGDKYMADAYPPDDARRPAPPASASKER